MATNSLTPPSVEMREVFRRYLINKKNYAVPRSKWVDARFTPGGTEGLETDAVLDAVIDQWDADALVGRGIVYIGGEFKLISAKDSKAIWSYRCRNVPIVIKQPRVPSNVTETVRAAVRAFAVRVLGTVPRT